MKNVTIVLPCHNGVRWISRAIESIVAQTYRDFELVIIDDGSTDNSKEIVTSYLSDERIRYIYQENRGFSGAVNRGIREGRGSLIGFIGQDDLWMPNKLELQVKYLNEHKNVDLVHSNYYSIDSEERIINLRNVKIPNAPFDREILKQLFLDNFIGFETVLVKRKCFDEIGFLDEHMTGYSDHDLWLRIAGSFNIRGYIDLPLVKKRLHQSQLSNARLSAVLKDELLMVKKAIDLHPFLRQVERRKLASLYYVWGTALLQKGNTQEAEQKLLKAIRCQPWKIKAAVAYIAPTPYVLILSHYQKFAQVHRGFSWIED